MHDMQQFTLFVQGKAYIFMHTYIHTYTQDVQQFTLFGERLADMRRVDHMNMCDQRKTSEGLVDSESYVCVYVCMYDSSTYVCVYVCMYWWP